MRDLWDLVPSEFGTCDGLKWMQVFLDLWIRDLVLNLWDLVQTEVEPGSRELWDQVPSGPGPKWICDLRDLVPSVFGNCGIWSRVNCGTWS
jgi:hypothetical protein